MLVPFPPLPSTSIKSPLNRSPTQVFRNQTSYNRFWDGRNYLTVIITSVRNLTRSFLACPPSHPQTNPRVNPSRPSSPGVTTTTNIERADTERTIRILIAILYATKNHLRADWGAEIIPGTSISPNTGTSTLIPEYAELLPKGLTALDDRGVGLPLQLTFFVEQYIKRCFDQGVFHGPQASQMQVQLNTLTDAYGRMETIRLTSIPIAHLYVPLPYLLSSHFLKHYEPLLRPLQDPPKTSPRPLRLRAPFRFSGRHVLVGRPHCHTSDVYTVWHRRHRGSIRGSVWV